MKSRPQRVLPVLLPTPLLLAAGYSDHGMAAAGDETVLLSVSPTAGAMSVDPTASVSVRFSHPVMPGMEEYALLHLGDATGSVVDGTWSLEKGCGPLRG